MKKFISIFIIFSIVININVLAHWADDSIEYSIQNGFLSPDSDFVANPDDFILRGEVAELIIKSKPEDIDIKNVFIGDENGDLKLNSEITREEFFVVIGRAFSISIENFNILNIFIDANDISDYAKVFICGLVKEKIILGYPGSMILPQDNITNAEAVTVIERIYRNINKKITPTSIPSTVCTSLPNISTPTPIPSPTPSLKPTFKPSGSGGSNSHHKPTVDTIAPEIYYSLSLDDLGCKSVTINIKVMDNKSLKCVRWVKAKKGITQISDQVHIPSDIDYKLLISYDMYDENSALSEQGKKVYDAYEKYEKKNGSEPSVSTIRNYYSNVYFEPLNGEFVEIDDWILNPEKYKDSSELLADDKIITKQNGVFYIYAEDIKGNRTIQSIPVENIKTAEATMSFIKYENIIDDIIGEIMIDSVTENSNAPIVEKYLVPSEYVTNNIGGGFIDTNYKISNEIARAQECGAIISETDEKYLIKEPGIYALVMLDEWENYSFSTVKAE